MLDKMVDFDVRGQQGIDFLSHYYGLVFWPEYQNMAPIHYRGSIGDDFSNSVLLKKQIPIYLVWSEGKTPEEASDLALTYMKERVDGLGGAVVVDPKGTWAAQFSSLQMSWAAAQQGELHFGLYHGEHFVEPVQENI